MSDDECNSNTINNSNGAYDPHEKKYTDEESLQSSATVDYTDPDYFPDGGAQAWLNVMCAFLVTVATWGITSSFGVFTPYYKKILLPHATSFQVGWINSVQTAFIFFGGSITGKLFDAGYFYYLEVAGGAVCFACFMLLGECKEYYQVFLAQGVALGLGMGMVFSPSIACTGAYFKKLRPFVMSVCTSGVGLGGAVIPIITNNLLYNVGFKWTCRILGFIELGLFVVIIAFMRDRIPRNVRQERLAKSQVGSHFFSLNSWIDQAALRDPVFILFALGIACCFLVTFSPYAYIQSFAAYVHAPHELTKYSVSVLGAASFFGRLATFPISVLVGPLTCTGLISMFGAITLYCWGQVHSTAGFVAFAVVYGLLSGIIGGLPPFITPQLTQDVTRLGVRLGMVFFCLGMTTVVSIPIAGLVLGSEYDRFSHLAILCGSCMMGGSVLLTCSRVARGGFKLARV